MDFVLELAKLIKTSPKLALPQDRCENSPYNSFLYASKNCYLCFSSGFLNDCYYCDTLSYCTDCADCDYAAHCELCYECTDCRNCYNCDFCKDCRSCSDCRWCFECYSISNCFGCVGLKNKSYHIFNVPYSKERYGEKMKEICGMPRDAVVAELARLRADFPHPAAHAINCENCFGDYLINSKNCYCAFDVEKSQDCAYIYDEINSLTDCVDCTHIANSQYCYNLMSADDCYNVDGSWWAVGSSNCSYGFCILQCKNCFGCVNLQRKEFHILNQPHSKDDYFKKAAEIISDLKAKGLHGKYLLMEAVNLAKTL